MKLQKLSKNIFTKKNLIIFLTLIIGIFLFRSYKKITLYSFFIIITGIIVYYSKLYHIPFDVTPLFFLEIVITRYFGLKYTLIYILLAYVLPKTMAGSGMNVISYAFITVSVVCNFLSLFMTGLGLQTVGYVTSIIQYVGGIFVSMTMVGKPFMFSALDGIANVTNNLLWFLIFSDLIVFLFK